ncbi:T9SS type A sorting domain-containing protein [Flavobacterium sp. AG291]|uniref:T9SS type A sorting domain-containing protein n=1 Tax=Flavobacterium sp. AG291 TaxID=2184000 RepID=UPI000E0AC577|nr:T9SS type A sorting domain-containing protein [Flavobacterium sp. AG291]RDI04551.1 putative secreted protein (Por secretion system target) [Flavobacterium sp. AG291]
MKKQLLAGAFVLASFLTAQAQILSNDFGTDQATLNTALTGWYTDTDTQDGVKIGFGLNADNDPLGFTGVSAFSDNYINTGTTEAPVFELAEGYFNFVLSPVVDLTSIEAAYVSMKVGVPDAEPTALLGYQILAILESDFAANNFENLYIVGEGTISNGEVETVNFALDAFAGEQVRLYFVHADVYDQSGTEPVLLTSGLGTLQIDDILVDEGVVAGVNDNTLANLSVYPNPVNDVVNVNVDALVSNVAIVDLNGRTVKTVKFDGVSTASVNVSDLASGVYMATITSDKGTTTKKIVKN